MIPSWDSLDELQTCGARINAGMICLGVMATLLSLLAYLVDQRTKTLQAAVDLKTQDERQQMLGRVTTAENTLTATTADAAEARRKYDLLRQTTTGIEKQLSSRSEISETSRQSLAVALLAIQHKTPMELTTIAADRETVDFASVIIASLNASGWPMELSFDGFVSDGVRPYQGIVIETNDDPTRGCVAELAAALRQSGISDVTPRRKADIPAGVIHVYIGPKPITK